MKKYFIVFLLGLFLFFSTSRVDAAVKVQALENPITATTPQQLIGLMLRPVFGVIGSLALLMFIYGGLTWMLSSGSQEKVKKGRDIIVWSVLGLMIIFSSYQLIGLILDTIGG